MMFSYRPARMVLAGLSLVIGVGLAACSGGSSGAGGVIVSGTQADPNRLPPGWPKELTLGLAGGVDAEAAMESNKGLADRLAKALGIPVKLHHAAAYSSVVQAMRAKRVDGLQVGVFSYLLAVQEANAEALAVYVNTFAEPAVYDPLIRPEYYSVISVKKGNGIASLADLRGRTFTFVEPASTSGHLVPKTELIKAGLVPDKDVKTRFSGGHSASLLALWNGTAEAAASAEPALSNARRNNMFEYCGFPENEIGRRRTPEEIKAVFDACPNGKLAPIHYSFPIPGTPIAFRADLPADLKAKIRESLLSTPADAEFIKSSKRWYVDPSKEMGLPNLDAYYNQLREVAKLLDLDLKGVDYK
jgi:phosphonate transport system substrate-binding protein